MKYPDFEDAIKSNSALGRLLTMAIAALSVQPDYETKTPKEVYEKIVAVTEAVYDDGKEEVVSELFPEVMSISSLKRRIRG